jgi:serine/threonine-protein kinase RsbW
MASEGRMLDRVTACLKEHRVAEADSHPILLMVSEAFTNALVHGNRLDPNKKVVMELTVNDSEITADILDEGHGGLERIENHKSGGLLAEGGRGLGLMRHYASKVDIAETEWGGLRVSITYSLIKEGKTC